MSNAVPAMFDPNVPDREGDPAGVVFPAVAHTFTAADYAERLCSAVDNMGDPQTFLSAVLKAAQAPPSMQTFAKLDLMPDTSARGIIQYPGFPPNMLAKIVEDHLIPKVIIQQRTADVMRYSEYSTQPWKPGWKIELREGQASPTTSDRKDILEARNFIQNCGVDFKDARERDAAQIPSLRAFLSGWVRDTYRFDAVAIWTDCDLKGAVRRFKLLPGGNIRLSKPEGYLGKRDIFAVGLDEAGKVVHEFTRRSLTYVTRNVRTDADTGGYGYSEVEMTARIIQAFTNAFDLNADTFNKSAIPNGILLAMGANMNQKQLDVLSRIWANLKRGTSKNWALPVFPLPKDGKLEVLDLSRMKGNDVYYQDFINMLAGLYCAMMCYPVDRLGYRVSGRGPDTSPDDKTTGGTIVDQADPGLAPLLGSMEQPINEYLIWSRWPHLQLRFQGKNPKEDARAYEAQMLSCTWDEKRALADKPPLIKIAGPEDKELARLMGLAPVDPNLAGVFQNVVSAQLGAKADTGPAAEMTSKRDPAKSEQHGHTSGVRRDSAAETKKANTLYVHRPLLNGQDFLDWAVDQGFTSTLEPHDLHVTVAFSRAPVQTADLTAAGDLEVQGGSRTLKRFGDAVVLAFTSGALQARWKDFRRQGASWDYDAYIPHITITYKGADLDLATLEPYRGPLVFGPEVFGPVKDDWVEGITEQGT